MHVTGRGKPEERALVPLRRRTAIGPPERSCECIVAGEARLERHSDHDVIGGDQAVCGSLEEDAPAQGGGRVTSRGGYEAVKIPGHVRAGIQRAR